MKLSFDGGDFVMEKYKVGYGGTYGGICIWREPGVSHSVLCWRVRKKVGFGHREDVFKLKLFYKGVV
jgi:hypothetical protein